MKTYQCPGPAPPQTAHEGPHPMCPECGPDYEATLMLGQKDDNRRARRPESNMNEHEEEHNELLMRDGRCLWCGETLDNFDPPEASR